MRLWRLAVLPVILILGVLVAACGGGAAEPTPAPTAVPPAVAPTVAPAQPTPVAVALSPTPAPVVRPTPTTAPAVVAQPPATPTPAPEQPRRGGILRASTWQELNPVRMDIGTDINSVGVFVLNPILNTLVQFDPYNQRELVGDLAERWTVSADGGVITFQLRKDVVWDDGTKFTSADVAWNLDRIMNPPPKGRISDLRETLGAIQQIETPDDYTLKLTLKYPSASFIPSLGVVRMAIYPKHVGIDQFVQLQRVTGTGPFKWSKYERPVSIDLVRSDTYFKKGLPYLDGIKFFIIGDPAAGLAAFRTGRVDFLDQSNNLLMGRGEDLQRQMPGIRIAKHYAGNRLLVLNAVSPLTDQRVRTAIHLALDREQLGAVGSLGDAEPLSGPNFAAVRGGIWGLPADELRAMPGYRQPKDQDIAEAKRLLAEAGIKPGTLKPFNFIIEDRNLPWGVVAQEQLKAIGIEVRLNVLERGVYLDAMPRGAFDMSLVAALPMLDDPSQVFPVYYTSTAFRNYGKFSNPKVDELTLQQEQTMDFARRKAIVYELEREVINWAIMPAMGWGLRPVGIHPWVRNLPDPTLFWSNVYRMEQVWLARN